MNESSSIYHIFRHFRYSRNIRNIPFYSTFDILSIFTTFDVKFFQRNGRGGRGTASANSVNRKMTPSITVSLCSREAKRKLEISFFEKRSNVGVTFLFNEPRTIIEPVITLINLATWIFYIRNLAF